MSPTAFKYTLIATGVAAALWFLQVRGADRGWAEAGLELKSRPGLAAL